MNLFRSLPLALLAGLALTGCNVFEGLYEAGTSNDPVVLMVDADQALQQGEPEKAVVILEKAVEKTPETSPKRAQVETKLGTAKLQAANVGVLQFHRVVEDLNDRIDFGTGFGKSAIVPAGQVCSFAAPDVAREVVEFRQLDAFSSLADNQAALEQVNELASRALARSYYNAYGTAQAMDNERLQRALADLFGAAERAPKETVQRFARDLKQLGIGDHLVELFTNFALGRAGRAYYAVSQAGGDQITWYRVESPSTGFYLGYCAPSQEVIDEIKNETACAMTDIKRSVQALDMRAYFFDETSLAREVADKAKEGYEKLQEELDGTCGG